MNKFITLLILCLSFLTASGTETSRPRLLLTKEGVREIKAQLGATRSPTPPSQKRRPSPMRLSQVR